MAKPQRIPYIDKRGRQRWLRADVRESTLENRCVKFAKQRGWLSRKMNGMGFNAWPDRLFLRPPRRLGPRRGLVNRRPLWVEFKRLGEEATPMQAKLHEELRAFGQLVYVIDTYEEFTKLFDTVFDTAAD